MGLFKKPEPITQVDDDEELRRAIRARVAKQAGIYDEEYIKTGKVGGGKSSEDPADIPASHVSAAAVPLSNESGQSGAAAPQPEPVVAPPPAEEPKPAVQAEAPRPEPVVAPPPAPKSKKPPKEKKQKKTKNNKSGGDGSKPKKGKRKTALIIFLLLLLLSAFPLYYFLSDMSNQVPTIKANVTEETLFPGGSLVVQGTASDPDEGDKIVIYYTLDDGPENMLYAFETIPGPFEKPIQIPADPTFIGPHKVTVYAKDASGEASESVVLDFNVIEPQLVSIEITKKPSDLKYEVGEELKLKGMVVTATFEDGTTTKITDFTSSIKDGSKLTQDGTRKIIISYKLGDIEKKASFKIVVSEAPVVTPPTASRQVDSSYPIPSLEVFQAGAGTADLQWNALSGVSGYQIQRKTGSGGSYVVVATLPSGYTSWTDNGPEPGGTYYYRICSYKVVNGVSVYSQFSSPRSVAF